MPLVGWYGILRWGIGLPDAPTTETHARVTVADQFGAILTELDRALVRVCSWRLNDYGKAEIEIAATDDKATLDNLAFGNLILLEFENGLPNWAGVIDAPRSWPKGSITVNAYGAAYLLTSRRTGKDQAYAAQSPGAIFQDLIARANTTHHMGIEIGTVWEGSGTHSISFNFADLYTVIKEQCCERLADADFDITGAISNGRIVLTANYYQSKGATRSGVALVESRNVSGDPVLEEQGPIYNVWRAIGPGSLWDDTRLIGYAFDQDSVDKYGYREIVESHTEVDSQTSLDEIAANRLGVTKDPRNRVALSVADLRPGLFSAYDVGDTVTIVLHSKGFGGYIAQARVITREYSPASGTCALVVEER